MATLFPATVNLPDLTSQNVVIVFAAAVVVLMLIVSVWSARTR